jgi:hypothetical protein
MRGHYYCGVTVPSTDAVNKDILRKYFAVRSDPRRILDELSTVISEMIERKKVSKEHMAKITEARMIIGMETHYPLAETTSERYHPLVIELAHQIVREYDCKTTSEKALAEMAAGAYVRSIEYARAFNDCLRIEFLSAEKTAYYAMLSKEADRAQRQFVMELTTLRQLKSPPFELNIKTRTAFVAQNQQLNTFRGSPSPEREESSNAST